MPADADDPDTEPLYERPALYDAIYAGEQHDREVEFVRRALPEDTEHLLEVGAGTGEATRRLAGEYRVTAVEPAGPMRERAEEKVEDRDGVTVREGALPEMHLGEGFDAVLALHSVLNYLEPDELDASVRTLADHLAPGGVLVTDNSLLPPADEGNAADYVVGETPTGRYVRVARMRPLGDRLEWVQVVFAPDDVLLDSHRLTPFDDDRVRRALVDADLSVATHQGYGTGDPEGTTDYRTVFVGRRAGSD